MGLDNEDADWQRVLTGDGEAFGRLFDAHHQRVHRHATRLVAAPHEAEDVLAGAFLELWRRRDKVRVVEGSVLPWLLVTTTNLALNQRRSMRRHRAFLARMPRSESRAADAASVALSRADLDIDPSFVDAIKGLSDTDQQLIALVAFEGYPLRAAAEALGLTEQAARSRWQRIRRRLASTMTPETLALATER